MTPEQRAALRPIVDGLDYYDRQTGPWFLRLDLRNLVREADIRRLVEAFRSECSGVEGRRRL